MRLEELPTPCLLLDPVRMQRNCERMQARIAHLGVRLRPHVKTAKCVEIGRLMTAGGHAITASTLREAEEFAAAGFDDLTYAVGIAPAKLPRVAELQCRGARTAVLLDSVEQARAVADAGLPAFIEIDSDGHRAGVPPDDRSRLLAIMHALIDGGELAGVLTHAGGSYAGGGPTALAAAAERERAAAVEAATTLRTAGFACPTVSVGSTPTAHAAASLAGVDEVRAGVYVFMDLTMVWLGICDIADIAISVLANVIGHQRERGWLITDAGWMALSRDRGAGNSGYGQICDLAGIPFPGVFVSETNQEHGMVAARGGAPLPDLPVGARVRILPNHACATAAQFDGYHVLGRGDEIAATWPRFGGW